MKSDCVIVNHENNNVVRTPAGLLIPNKSVITNCTSNLNSYGKQVQVNDSGSANVNGATEACKTYNGTNGALNKQIKSGQFINHYIVASNENNNQVRNKVNCRGGNGLNGNPLVLVTTSVDTNRSLSSKSGNFDGIHELHLSNGVGKIASKKCDCVTRSCINNLDNVNGTFNEKNPGAGGLFDASLVTQVNLAAAFHDHVSYTKIGSEIIKNGGVLTGFNGAPTSKKIQVQDTEVLSHQGNKEQVFKLKTMILTHLDLIQHQQEMLLKKDRQLQGLKQDRESLLSRLEKMEKKMSIMSKKIISLTELSAKNADKTEPQFKAKVCEATKSSGSPSVSSASSSPIFSDYFSSESASNALFIKLTSDLREQEDDEESSDMMVIKSDGQLSSPAKKCKKACLSPLKSSNRKRNRSGLKLDITPEVKNVSKGTSTSSTKKKVFSNRKKQSSTSSSASSTISSLDSEKSDMIDGSMVVEGINKPEEIPFSFMISHDLYEVVNMWDVEELEQEERKRVMSSFKMRNSFPVYTSNKNEEETDSTVKKDVDGVVDNRDDQLSNEIPSTINSEIEVPSWRILDITGSHVSEGLENLDDEVYNKRHSKMEIDERRRKRWDIQRLREQKHNEKLKQGRYYSKAAFVSSDIKYQPNSSIDTLKNEPEPVSFFPDPMDAQVIEVCDELPLLAFGHPIPIIPEKTKSDRNPQSAFKSRKGNDHATPSSGTEDHKATATETTSLTTPKSASNCQLVPKGAKPFCSTKKMSISVS